MRLFLSRALVSAAVLAVAVAGFLPAVAQPASPLQAAMAQASGEGWQVQTLAGGGRAAIGVGAVDRTTYVIGIACGARKYPEVLVEARGGSLSARALLAGTVDMIIGFPLVRSGAAPPAVDALVAGLFDPADATFGLWLDEQAFPDVGAREAFEAVGKDCAERTGWQYGIDDDRQLAWVYMPRPDDLPLLTFGKPSSGLVLAQLTCDRRGSLIVKSTTLPQRAKSGQKVRLLLRADEREYAADGHVELYAEGDVSGFVIARFSRPQGLFEALRQAGTTTIQARGTKLTISAAALGAMLPRFRSVCGM